MNKIGPLTAQQTARLRPSVPASHDDCEPMPPAPQDAALLSTLRMDGRATYRDLAAGAD